MNKREQQRIVTEHFSEILLTRAIGAISVCKNPENSRVSEILLNNKEFYAAVLGFCEFNVRDAEELLKTIEICFRGKDSADIELAKEIGPTHFNIALLARKIGYVKFDDFDD